MKELIARYLESLRLQKHSPKSIAVYSYALDRWLKFLIARRVGRMQDVNREDLHSYRLELVESPLASASVHSYLGAVRQFFDWLEAQQLLFLNPAAGLSIPKTHLKLQPVPSEEEMHQLLVQPDTTTASGLRDRALLETAYSTGARRGELCGMQVEDLDLERGFIRVSGKGSKERMVPLGKEAVVWIKEYLEKARPVLLRENGEEEALWISTRGKPLGYASLAAIIGQHVRAANIQTAISWHGIRRACATHMLRRGAHPAQLQQLLGHSSLKTLSQYLQLTINDLKATHAKSGLAD